MPSSRTLISSQTLSSTTASVTFNSIPATYTDLVIKWSARQTYDAVNNGGNIRFNGDSSLLYSFTEVYGDGSAAQTSGSGNQNSVPTFTPGATPSATSNTFSNNELYIANYAGSASKVLSHFQASESNVSTGPFISGIAGLYRSSSAITSITLNAGFSYVTGSSFYLYGIKNS